MPYITKKERKVFDKTVELLIKQLDTKRAKPFDLFDSVPNQTAYVTYIIYKLLRRLYGKLSWHHRAQVYLILESVRSEFQRNCMNAYEDAKKQENGDVG